MVHVNLCGYLKPTFELLISIQTTPPSPLPPTEARCNSLELPLVVREKFFRRLVGYVFLTVLIPTVVRGVDRGYVPAIFISCFDQVVVRSLLRIGIYVLPDLRKFFQKKVGDILKF